ALLDRGLLDREEYGRGTQTVRGGRERHRGASRIFIEQVEDDLAGKLAAGLASAVGSEEQLRPVQDRRDLVVAQRIDGNQVHELCAYCGPGRLTSASIAPWRMWAAASA